MELTATNVHEVFMKCLFADGEDTAAHVVAEGVMNKVGFHPIRLEENKANIAAMLNNLPDNFRKDGGGGWSFLNACEDKNGNQWADLHSTIDELVMLGNGIGRLSFLMPRELWSTLPGGMPYFVVN